VSGDLTVRLVLTADGRALRAEVLGAQREIETFASRAEAAGVRVERGSAEAAAAIRRIGAAADVAGAQIDRSLGGAGAGALARLRANLGQVGFQVGDFVTQVQAGGNAFTAFAQQGGQLAGALAGGLAGLVVQIGAVAAQWLFASDATARAVAEDRAFLDGAEAINRVLTTREERTRRAAAATLDLAQRTAEARLEGLRAAREEALLRQFNLQRALAGLERDLAEASPRSRRGVQSDIEEARRELAQVEAVLRIQAGLLADAQRQAEEIGRLGTTNLLAAPAARSGLAFHPFALLRRAARQLEQELRTPLERYADEVQRLENLFAAGLISQDLFWRGVARASEELERAQRGAAGAADGLSAMERGFDRLADSVQGFGRDAARALAEALVGLRALDGGVVGLIQRLASGVIEKLIYEQITGPLTQAAAALLRSGLASLFGPALGPTTAVDAGIPVSAFPFHSGGIVGREGAAARQVPAALFAGAPRLHSGGLIGPGEVPAILRAGEGVFTPEQMQALGGTVVQVIDQRGAGAPPAEVSRERGPDGRQIVRVLIRSEVAAMVADGALDRVLGAGYGLQRAGVR
jgi:hypothetical protein